MNKLNNKRINGFTLVEMLIVISIASVLIAAGVMLFSNIVNNYITIQRFDNLATQAEQSILLMSKELRTAQSITSGTSSTISFNNKNGLSINYRLSGTDLQRDENGTYYTVNALVNSFALSYFDSNLAELSMPINVNNIRLITIKLNLSQDINHINLIRTVYLVNS